MKASNCLIVLLGERKRAAGWTLFACIFCFYFNILYGNLVGRRCRLQYRIQAKSRSQKCILTIVGNFLQAVSQDWLSFYIVPVVSCPSRTPFRDRFPMKKSRGNNLLVATLLIRGRSLAGLRAMVSGVRIFSEFFQNFPWTFLRQ